MHYHVRFCAGECHLYTNLAPSSSYTQARASTRIRGREDGIERPAPRQRRKDTHGERALVCLSCVRACACLHRKGPCIWRDFLSGSLTPLHPAHCPSTQLPRLSPTYSAPACGVCVRVRNARFCSFYSPLWVCIHFHAPRYGTAGGRAKAKPLSLVREVARVGTAR